MFGFGKLSFWTFEADLRQVVTEHCVGPIEPSLGRRELRGKILAHADGLRTLPGKQ